MKHQSEPGVDRTNLHITFVKEPSCLSVDITTESSFIFVNNTAPLWLREKINASDEARRVTSICVSGIRRPELSCDLTHTRLPSCTQRGFSSFTAYMNHSNIDLRATQLSLCLWEHTIHTKVKKKRKLKICSFIRICRSDTGLFKLHPECGHFFYVSK